MATSSGGRPVIGALNAAHAPSASPIASTTRAMLDTPVVTVIRKSQTGMSGVSVSCGFSEANGFSSSCTHPP